VSGAWCGAIFLDIKSTFIDGFLYVGGHVNGGSAIAVVGDVHTKELMDWAVGNRHFAKAQLQEVKHYSDNGGVDMGDVHVIDVPSDGTLGAIDGGIGNAEVIRIEDETAGNKDGGEKFVPEETPHDAAVIALLQRT
jgi:hypothetical protein